MALPRSKYVQEGQEGVYHCFSFSTCSHSRLSPILLLSGAFQNFTGPLLLATDSGFPSLS